MEPIQSSVRGLKLFKAHQAPEQRSTCSGCSDFLTCALRNLPLALLAGRVCFSFSPLAWWKIGPENCHLCVSFSPGVVFILLYYALSKFLFGLDESALLQSRHSFFCFVFKTRNHEISLGLILLITR